MIISHGAAAGAREPVNEGTDCRMPSHPPPCAPLPPPPLLPPATPPAPTSAGVQPETGTGGGEERNAIFTRTHAWTNGICMYGSRRRLGQAL